MDYKTAGVDLEAGYRAVDLMKDAVKQTQRPEVLGDLGGFSGAFDLGRVKKMQDPVLLSGTDGCGTKVKLAFVLDRHDTIGIDAVAMCVNDIACGKNIPEKISAIVGGVAAGCLEAGCALLGGETAEHPGLMPPDEYDLAGFAVGVAERAELIDGSAIHPKDVLIGLASSGVHSNGYSLIRQLFPMTREALQRPMPELDGQTLGEALLRPTKIYVGAMRQLKQDGVLVKGASHITGGGFYENVPRMLPEGMTAVIRKDRFPVPAIFRLIQDQGALSEEVLYHTFNMGLGMVLAVAPTDVDQTLKSCRMAGETPFVVGEVKAGTEGVILC